MEECLKECPLCGSEAEVNGSITSSNFSLIRCSNTGCTGYDNYFNRIKWNTRPSQADEKVRKAKEALIKRD